MWWIVLVYCQGAFWHHLEHSLCGILASYDLFHQKAQDGRASALCKCVGVCHDTWVRVEGLRQGIGFCLGGTDSGVCSLKGSQEPQCAVHWYIELSVSRIEWEVGPEVQGCAGSVNQPRALCIHKGFYLGALKTWERSVLQEYDHVYIVECKHALLGWTNVNSSM